MKKSTSRRMNPTFGYRGSAQNHSNTFTFNRRPPFSKIKEIYGNELERFELENPTNTLQNKELPIQKRKETKCYHNLSNDCFHFSIFIFC